MATPITLQDLEALADEIDYAEGWYAPWQFEDIPDEDGEIAYEAMMDAWASEQTAIDAMYEGGAW